MNNKLISFMVSSLFIFCSAIFCDETKADFLMEKVFQDSKSNNKGQPAQQVNDITSFLDGSVIYGSDKTRADALRLFKEGKLKTSDGDLPPLNTDGLPNANDAQIVPDKELFLAGDVRANENVELSAIHALFVREHNLIADIIHGIDPSLMDEKIYQMARKIVSAELQVITYKEFLPALLGPDALKPYAGYNSSVNPSISNEFSTAAFRVGHTLINDDVEFLDNDGNTVRDEIELRDAFFNPATIKQVGPDPILKYLATDNAQEVDLMLVDGLRNFLFGPPGAGGFDLAARNIQRGRDHGIADYNTVRKKYGLPPVSDFKEITKDTNVQEKLCSLYKDVNNIDLWVGGLAEDHAPNASVGPTFQRIIASQFERLRDGDRFWYERVFTGNALNALESVTLSQIIRRNTTITKLQDNVFFYHPADPSEIVDSQKSQNDKKGADALVQLMKVLNTLGGEMRSWDGSGNNSVHSDWGKAGTDLLRTVKAEYSDGVYAPAGDDRPSARLISNTLSAQTESHPNDRFLSDWIYGWGQFIDHDLDLTTTGTTAFDISVPKGDPFFDPQQTGTQVIILNRSNYDPNTGPGAQPVLETYKQKFLKIHRQFRFE